MISRLGFWAVILLCLSPLAGLPKDILPFVSPAALILGIALALTVGNPYPAESKKVSKTLLQMAVVLLGFSLEISKVIQAGVQGLGFAVLSIGLVFLLAAGLRRVLNVRPLTSLLVASGTAICGGSAIAAISSVTDAPQEDVSVSIGTVFLLNAVGLILFPVLGHALHLTAPQFGVWAGIAIHDVASVVGAAAAFNPESLDTATAVKLSRVLYLVPITFIIAAWRRRTTENGDGKPASATWPWFILWFMVACAARSLIPSLAPFAPQIKLLAGSGFAVALFLIGGGINRKTLQAVGFRPLLEGLILWIVMIGVGLVMARSS